MMMAKVDRARPPRGDRRAQRRRSSPGVPRPAAAGQITFYEEERVQAYFGGGYLYATAGRQEPLL